MTQAVPSWVFTGATVWAWLPQKPNPYYISTTRWECQILAVKHSRSRVNPTHVILSVPTEVYMGKTFKQYYPLYDDYVEHPTNPDAEALKLNVHRGGTTIVLEQLEAVPIGKDTASQTPNTESTGSTASTNTESATAATASTVPAKTIL